MKGMLFFRFQFRKNTDRLSPRDERLGVFFCFLRVWGNCMCLTFVAKHFLLYTGNCMCLTFMETRYDAKNFLLYTENCMCLSFGETRYITKNFLLYTRNCMCLTFGKTRYNQKTILFPSTQNLHDFDPVWYCRTRHSGRAKPIFISIRRSRQTK